MGSDRRSDAALLAASSDEPEAFGVFYRRHAPWVLRYVARQVRDREAVADLTAEIFSKALISLPRYDSKRGAPGAWLFGITAHELARYHRRGNVRRRAQQRLGIRPRALDDADFETAEAEDAARVVLAELPREQREAVRARVIDDLSYAVIAEDLGVSESVVRKRVSRGLRTLRRTTSRSQP